MTNPVAREEKSYQVINRCSLAGKILFEPKKGKKFPLRFAQIWYELNGGIPEYGEKVTDDDGKFFFEFVPNLDGRIAISMKIVIDGKEICDLKKIGGGEYIFYFPKEKNQSIGSVAEDPVNIEIVLDNEENQPDFIIREIIISAFKEKKEELTDIFLDEIKNDIYQIFNQYL